MLKKKWLLLLLVLAGAGYAYYARNTYEPADARFTGAYRFADGRLAVVTPTEPDQFRLRFQQEGKVQRLHLTDGDAFDSFRGFVASDKPAATGRFVRSDNGDLTGLELSSGATARRLSFAERIGRFDSKELSLRGKLVLPSGPGPHPLVVLVHGSESYSAVDYYYMPYILAAHGFAAVAYDKRGTGKSDGEYTQDFFALAADATAAAAWASSDPKVDAQRINLMGFSQGGWIAPIAAKTIPGMRGVSIHYGVAVSVTREDRWGYVYELKKQGFGEDEIRKADEINAVLGQIIDERRSEAWADLDRIVAKYKDSEWFKAVAGSDSILGRVAQTSLPSWMWRAYLSFVPPPSVPRTWDPKPTLAELDIPQHWILAGEDSSTPTPESVAVLEELRAAGKPIDIRIFADTEHGIVTFDQDESGKRTSTGYAKTYVDETLAWLKDKNGVEQ